MASVVSNKPLEELAGDTRDMHRAVVSLMDEMETVAWSSQRADSSRDMELQAILVHIRDEGKEYASMLPEQIRHNDPTFSSELKAFRLPRNIFRISAND